MRTTVGQRMIAGLMCAMGGLVFWHPWPFHYAPLAGVAFVLFALALLWRGRVATALTWLAVGLWGVDAFTTGRSDDKVLFLALFGLSCLGGWLWWLGDRRGQVKTPQS